MSTINFNSSIQNVPEWSETLLKVWSIFCKIFKVCLAIGMLYVKGLINKKMQVHEKHTIVKPFKASV